MFYFQPKPISVLGKSGFGRVILKLSGKDGGNRKVNLILRRICYIAEVIPKVIFIAAYEVMKTWLKLRVKKGMTAWTVFISEPLLGANSYKRCLYSDILSVISGWVINKLANT